MFWRWWRWSRCLVLPSSSKRNSNAPQTNLNARQTHLKRIANSPQTQFKRTSDAFQTHLKPPFHTSSATSPITVPTTSPTASPPRNSESRLVKALFSLVMPLLGAAILFSGSFSRSGFFYRISFAVMLLFGLNTLRGAAESYVEKAPDHAFMLYSPVLLAVFIIVALITITTKGWNRLNISRLTSRKRAQAWPFIGISHKNFASLF